MFRWITLISLVSLFIVALFLAYANGAMVTLDYLVGSEEVHLSAALLGAVVAGFLIGLASAFGVVFRLKRDMRRQRRSLEEAESEIRSLRSVPPRDER